MQIVPAVSMMSSTRMAVLPSTSPMMSMTSETLATSWERRLSTMARSDFSMIAKLRARETPPTSGETTTTSPFGISSDRLSRK